MVKRRPPAASAGVGASGARAKWVWRSAFPEGMMSMAVMMSWEHLSAYRRDERGLQRDVRASRRDRVARDYKHDRDPGTVDRFAAGSDRDLAAGDRADSHDDRNRGAESRRRAAEDRQRAADDRDAAAEQAATAEKEVAGLREALTTRVVIGQAEGLLMARYDFDTDAAFALLVKLSQQTHVKLRDVAERIIADHIAVARARKENA